MRFDHLALLMFMAGALIGCGSAQVAEPLTGTTSGNDEASQLEFYHTLAERNMASNDEAFHALLLFFHGEDPADTYPGRVAALKANGFLPDSYDRPSNLAVTKGDMAVVIVNALDIKGGLTMRVLGPSPRYALKELQQLGLAPPGSSANQTISGSQVLTVIGKMEDYQATHGTAGVLPIPDFEVPPPPDTLDDADAGEDQAPPQAPDAGPASEGISSQDTEPAA